MSGYTPGQLVFKKDVKFFFASIQNPRLKQTYKCVSVGNARSSPPSNLLNIIHQMATHEIYIKPTEQCFLFYGHGLSQTPTMTKKIAWRADSTFYATLQRNNPKTGFGKHFCWATYQNLAKHPLSMSIIMSLSQPDEKSSYFGSIEESDQLGVVEATSDELNLIQLPVSVQIQLPEYAAKIWIQLSRICCKFLTMLVSK